MNIDYESMKELIEILNKYDINYTFGNYYSSDGLDKIVGHWLKIDADLETHDLDDDDRKYNE